MSKDHDKRIAALFAVGKLIASNAVAEIGLCNAKIALCVAAGLIIGMHAGHHDEEPEVDIAKALATIKEAAKVMLEQLPSDFNAKP